MSDFIASLDPPLGIAKPNTLAIVSFDLPIAKGDKIHCLDVLHSLTKYTLGFVEDESEDFAKLTEQETCPKCFIIKKTSHYFCAIIILGFHGILCYF
jgi:hypothetical protein